MWHAPTPTATRTHVSHMLDKTEGKMVEPRGVDGHRDTGGRKALCVCVEGGGSVGSGGGGRGAVRGNDGKERHASSDGDRR